MYHCIEHSDVRIPRPLLYPEVEIIVDSQLAVKQSELRPNAYILCICFPVAIYVTEIFVELSTETLRFML